MIKNYTTLKLSMFIAIFNMVIVNGQLHSSQIYLFQYDTQDGSSCCLHLAEDICNPGVACSYNIRQDLSGIKNYLTRLLGLEKTSTFSYTKMLKKAVIEIDYFLQASTVQLSYQEPSYRDIEFFHDLLEQSKNHDARQKSSTNGPSTANNQSTADSKAKGEDVIFQYLAKLGLANRHKR